MEINEDLLEAVKQVQEGSEEGFIKLYSYTHNFVFFRCKSLLKNDDEAWDVLQEVYIVAFKSLSRLKDNSKIYSWLGSIAYFLSMKAYRKKKDILLGEEGEGLFNEIQSFDKDIQPEQALNEKESCNIIKELIDQLPELQKAAVIAYYFDQMNVKEIAMVFGCSEGTIKSRLNYARQFLKQAIENKEKKYGIKLHSTAIPTIFLAWQLSLKDSTTYAKTAENVYNIVSSNLGLKTKPTQLGDNITNNQAGQIKQLSEVIKVKNLTYKFVATSMKTKVLVFGAIAIVGASSVVGYVSTMQKVDNKEEQVAQINNTQHIYEDSNINTTIYPSISVEMEEDQDNLIESVTNDLSVSEEENLVQQDNENMELNVDMDNKQVTIDTAVDTPTVISDNTTIIDYNKSSDNSHDSGVLENILFPKLIPTPTLVPVTAEPIETIPSPTTATPEPVADVSTLVTVTPVSDEVTSNPTTTIPEHVVTPTPIPSTPIVVVTPTPIPSTPIVVVTPTPIPVIIIPTHTHSYTSVVTTPEDCTTNGIRTYTCIDGDDSYTEVILAGHDEGTWYEQTATTTRIGVKVRACNRCKIVLEVIETSPALTPTPTPIAAMD